MDNIRPIHNDEDLAWAIREVDRYFDDEPTPGSLDADRFDVLSVLIEAYENKVFPIEPLEPIEFLKAHMELTDRKQSDLAALLGSASRASEVLNRKRPLTLDMIYRLHSKWDIPSDCLIGPYPLQQPA